MPTTSRRTLSWRSRQCPATRIPRSPEPTRAISPPEAPELDEPNFQAADDASRGRRAGSKRDSSIRENRFQSSSVATKFGSIGPALQFRDSIGAGLERSGKHFAGRDRTPTND